MAFQRGQVGLQFLGRQQVDEQVIVRVQRRGFFPQAQQQFAWRQFAAAVGVAQVVQAKREVHGVNPLIEFSHGPAP
ncbi:hypothetical protein D3C84_1150020 [compost metagenome]